MIYDEQIAFSPDETPFKRSPEVDNYETEADDVEAWAVCTIDLVLNDNTRYMAEDIFGHVYETTYGVLIFDSSDANPIQLTESEFLIDLPYPEFDSTWDNEEEAKLTE